jgi:hypothetical protein
MSNNGNFPNSSLPSFQVGDKVRIKLAAYRCWYEENVPTGIWVLQEDVVTVFNTDRADDTKNLIGIQGSGWGVFLPAQFLEKI